MQEHEQSHLDYGLLNGDEHTQPALGTMEKNKTLGEDENPQRICREEVTRSGRISKPPLRYRDPDFIYG